MPVMMVSKIMGLINNLTRSINLVPSGCIATPVAGEIYPIKIPMAMELSTQKVRFLYIFFNRAHL
jgi:hypothetical protein